MYSSIQTLHVVSVNACYFERYWITDVEILSKKSCTAA